MRRNPDLIEKILVSFEAIEMPGAEFLEIGGFSDKEIYLHTQLLADEKLLEAKFYRTQDDTYSVLPFRLTQAGYNLLDSLREPKTKLLAKKLMTEGAVFLSEIVKEIAKRNILS